MIKLPPTEENHGFKAQKIFCTICKEVPYHSHFYKCNMGGHIICYGCFSRLPKTGGARCSKCNSVILKMRNTSTNSDKDKNKSMTIEELFQLPSDQVHLLLNKNSQDKLENNQDTSSENLEILKKGNTQMCKPLKCPHGLCGKTVNVSSLKVHFVYEHSDINTYLLKRGEELHVVSNVSIIEYSISHCIGMVEIYDEYEFVSRVVNGVYKKDTQKVSVATFWVMASGSSETKNSKAYALYWLVTDSELPFKCTLEISSLNNNCSCATFCGVNDIRDNLAITDVANRMNCLYLSYGSLLNLKGTWGEVNLRITIH